MIPMTDDQIDAAAMEIYDQDMYRHNVDIEYRTPWGNRHDTGRFGKNAYRTMVLRVITALDIPAIWPANSGYIPINSDRR